MASVKKEEIPIMAMFMPRFWEMIKEFYGIEDNDEYWHALQTNFAKCIQTVWLTI